MYRFMEQHRAALLAPEGPLAVEVLAANLAGDGVPGNGDDTDQDFVLVISNGRTV
mgnify:CR=1 FL=1